MHSTEGEAKQTQRCTVDALQPHQKGGPWVHDSALGFAKTTLEGFPAPSYQLADPVQDQVNNLLADGVVASGVIIGCIFLPGDQLLRVEELPVGPCAHFIYKEDTCAMAFKDDC